MHSVLNLLNRIALVPGTPDRSIEACSLLAAHLTSVYQASSSLVIGEHELNQVASSFAELYCWLKQAAMPTVSVITDGGQFDGDVATLLTSVQNMISAPSRKIGGRLEFHLDNDFIKRAVHIRLMDEHGLVEERVVDGKLSPSSEGLGKSNGEARR